LTCHGHNRPRPIAFPLPLSALWLAQTETLWCERVAGATIAPSRRSRAPHSRSRRLENFFGLKGFAPKSVRLFFLKTVCEYVRLAGLRHPPSFSCSDVKLKVIGLTNNRYIGEYCICITKFGNPDTISTSILVKGGLGLELRFLWLV
jgi:hypothetical protein